MAASSWLTCGCGYAVNSRGDCLATNEAAWGVLLPPFKTASAITTAAVAAQLCKEAQNPVYRLMVLLPNC
jgi:hypothetical protein